jgi:hypothetical protein
MNTIGKRRFQFHLSTALVMNSGDSHVSVPGIASPLNSPGFNGRTKPGCPALGIHVSTYLKPCYVMATPRTPKIFLLICRF